MEEYPTSNKSEKIVESNVQQMEKKYRIESFASNFEDFCFPWNFEIETYKLEILQNNRVDVKKPKLKFSRRIFLNFNDFYFYNIDTIICRFIAREKTNYIH